MGFKKLKVIKVFKKVNSPPLSWLN